MRQVNVFYRLNMRKCVFILFLYIQFVFKNENKDNVKFKKKYHEKNNSFNRYYT